MCLVGVNKRHRGLCRQLANRIEPQLHGLIRGQVLQELLGCGFLLPIGFRADAIHPVGREIVTLAIMARQLGNCEVQPFLLNEFRNSERTVKNHTRLAGGEGVLAAVHETVCANLVCGLKIRQILQRLSTCVRWVDHLFAVIRIGLPAIEPDEHLTPPMVVLAICINREAYTQIVAISIFLGQFLCVIDHLIQRFRWTRQSCLGEHVLIPEQRQRAHRRWKTPIFTVNLHSADHWKEILFDGGMGKGRTGQRLYQTAFAIIIQPAVIELHNIGAITGRNRNGYLLAIVCIWKVRVLDGDTGIGCLKILDQLIDRFHSACIGVLPILDLDGLNHTAP